MDILKKYYAKGRGIYSDTGVSTTTRFGIPIARITSLQG